MRAYFDRIAIELPANAPNTGAPAPHEVAA
jgi:hypothetical protein